MRTTLENRETREDQMRAHIAAVAQAILDDTSGDAVLAHYLAIKRNVRQYSIGNLMLQEWQAPDSSLVAARSAFDQMAKAQGHTPKRRQSRDRKRSWDEYVWVAAGSKAVWIWGSPKPTPYTAKVTDPETGEVTEEERSYNRFFPVENYAVEDIRYCDTGEPFELPSFVVPVEDLDLYDATLAFAASRGIAVSEEHIRGGAVGVSRNGAIATRTGASWQEKLPTLLHEIAHELMHWQHDGQDLPHSVVEAEAEATCAVILQHFGHGVGPQAAYLRHWQAKPKDIIASMDRIAKASSQVVAFIEDAASAAREAPRGVPAGESAQTPAGAIAAA